MQSIAKVEWLGGVGFEPIILSINSDLSTIKRTSPFLCSGSMWPSSSLKEGKLKPNKE